MARSLAFKLQNTESAEAKDHMVKDAAEVVLKGGTEVGARGIMYPVREVAVDGTTAEEGVDLVLGVVGGARAGATTEIGVGGVPEGALGRGGGPTRARNPDLSRTESQTPRPGSATSPRAAAAALLDPAAKVAASPNPDPRHERKLTRNQSPNPSPQIEKKNQRKALSSRRANLCPKVRSDLNEKFLMIRSAESVAWLKEKL